MLKRYIVNGKQYKYEEGEQPKGAIEVKTSEAPKNKARTPAKNKSTKKKEK